MLAANSRTPDERAGDLDAQIGANLVGIDRLAGFSEAPLDEITAYGERRMRAALGQLGAHGVEETRALTVRHPGALQF